MTLVSHMPPPLIHLGDKIATSNQHFIKNLYTKQNHNAATNKQWSCQLHATHQLRADILNWHRTLENDVPTTAPLIFASVGPVVLLFSFTG